MLRLSPATLVLGQLVLAAFLPASCGNDTRPAETELSAAGAPGNEGGASSDGGTAGAGDTGTNPLEGGSSSGGEGGAGGALGREFPWPDGYDPTSTSDPATGKHRAGEDCATCHVKVDSAGGSSVARPFLFAGTVYDRTSGAGAAHVEVGVTDGRSTFFTYSGENGNFFLVGAGAIDWSLAWIATRDARGSRVQAFGSAVGPSCNQSGCHDADTPLLAR